MTEQKLCEDGSEIDLSVSEALKEGGLEHVSKSRVKTYMTCPAKFWMKYWCENRSPGNFYTERGTQVHRAYEEWHENVLEYIEVEKALPDNYSELLGDWQDYGQWMDPYLVNFWKFEDRRWKRSFDYITDEHGPAYFGDEVEDQMQMVLDLWKPRGVEVEGRLEDPPIGDLPWMGYADALIHAATLPDIGTNEGLVVLDYKTGKVPDKKYREDGIYLEGEFYGWLFEEELSEEIAGVAGYYPKSDELIVSPYPNEERRHQIRKAVMGMQRPPDFENYDINENPLCNYGHGECFFYDDCPTTWGTEGGSGPTYVDENKNPI